MAIKIAPPEPDSPEVLIRHRDTRAFWRLSAWGFAAAIALAALGITTQTEGGSERLQLAFAGASPHAIDIAALAQRVLEKDAETKAIEAKMLAIAADRDRISARLASLEHNLEDMTGSIKRQAALTADAPTAKSPAPTLSTLAPLAMPPGMETIATWPGNAPAQTTTAAPVVVPLPPTRVAAAPASEPAAQPPHKSEFGVDLGGAHSMEVLNARWTAVKANFGPLLTGFYPLAAPDHRLGSTDFRLLVGPVANPAAAMALCARFTAARLTCRTAKFDGERLAQR